MLHLLDETLEAFLRDVVPLPARDVDIAFDAPDGEWSASLSTRMRSGTGLKSNPKSPPARPN